jgi:hypothetical protein
MPKAIEQTATSRRALLGGGAALAVVAAVPAASPDAGQHPNGELLALIAGWWATIAETDALLGPVEDLPSADPRWQAAWQRHSDELSPRFHELKWRIATTPARTPDGLRAKAHAARRLAGLDVNTAPCGDAALFASLVHDVLGLPPVLRQGEG